MRLPAATRIRRRGVVQGAGDCEDDVQEAWPGQRSNAPGRGRWWLRPTATDGDGAHDGDGQSKGERERGVARRRRAHRGRRRGVDRRR